jgi:alpha-ketoglutarate-dependent taurine dioxygenase
MVKEISIEELRRHLGIKKLKSKIPVSDFERAALKRIREDEKERVMRAHRPRVKA